MATIKLEKCDKYEHIFFYFNAKNEKMYAYRYRYTDKNGKQKEKRKQGFKSERQAYRSVLEVIQLIMDGNTILADNEHITVAQWCERWLEFNKNHWKITTHTQRLQCIRDIIIPRIGKKKLSKLDKMTYQEDVIDDLVKEGFYAASTIRLFHNIFKIAVNAAVEEEVLDKNRIAKVRLPKIERTDNVDGNYYDMHELREFLLCADKDESESAKMGLKILAATGMRKGELQALTWKNIIIVETRNMITIEATRDLKGMRTPKTENSYRSVEISNELYEQLMIYKLKCKQLCLFNGIKFNEDNYVLISSQTGKAISDGFIASGLERIYRNNPQLKKITPHGFRHTLATIFINEGIPVPTIAKILGNTAAIITETYAHSIKEKENEALEITRKISAF